MQLRITLNWTSLVLVLSASLYAQPEMKSLPPLQNTHRITFKGLVKPAQIAHIPNGTGAVTSVNVPDLCNFEMMLKPGQNHVEARMVGPVRQTNTGCEADFDVGIPTVIQPPPQSLGAPVSTLSQASSSTTSTLTTITGDQISIGHSNGNAPDLSAVFDSSNLAVSPLDASPQFSSGYINGIVYDLIKIQVTYVNLYVGWVWTQTGTCVTNGSYSQYLTDYWPTGWFLASNSPSEYTNCNGVVNYTYALFDNPTFCAQTPTLVYYWPIQVQGWQDGTLYGNFNWIIGGLCTGLLTPAYQLNRSVN